MARSCALDCHHPKFERRIDCRDGSPTRRSFRPAPPAAARARTASPRGSPLAARWVPAPARGAIFTLCAALAQGGTALAQPAGAPVAPAGASNEPAAFPLRPSAEQSSATSPLSDDNLLLFEVTLDQLSITDSLGTYDSPGGPLIPLGELSRLLDLDLAVLPAERRVTGTLGEARRAVLVDAASATLRVNGQASPIEAGDVVVGQTDIYVRPALLERLLPVKAVIDKAGLRILLHALEPLPIQSRLDRLARGRGLRPDLASRNEVLKVAEPYLLAGAPSFDVSLASAMDNTRKRRFSTRYDLRAGADLLRSGFQAYLGSDDAGEPATMRILFERRDPDGRTLGSLGVTRASLGDIFTPSLAIGPRSQGGRGFSFTTAPLEQASVFEQIDLRGELPIGYDVELYVNDVLRGSQQKPVEGRYEFLAVPLVRGLNAIRLVSYGPHGERSEEVRVINVGGGQVEKGRLVVDAGIEQEGRDVVNLNHAASQFEPGSGRLRAAINVAYGLTEAATLVGGVGSYSPTGRSERQVTTLGVRSSLSGWSLGVDGAFDSTGASGATVGLAGSIHGISTLLRHTEYRGGFVDETIPAGGDGRPLTRYSEITLDWAVKPFGKVPIPLTVQVEHEQFTNGDVDLRGTVRASSAVGGWLVSGGLDLDRIMPADRSSTSQAAAHLSASTNIGFQWQVRGDIDFDLRRANLARDASITVDHAISRTVAVRLGLGHSFEIDRNSTANASVTFRLPFANLSIDGAYIAPRGDWRVGVALTFSLARDPLGRRYAVRRIGAASGGNLALQAFVDRNGDGLYDPGDQPVSGLAVSGGLDRAVTDAKGRALITGLGYGPSAHVQTDLQDVAVTDVIAPPATIEFTPHSGGVAVAMYPLKPQGEVLVRLLFRQADGSFVGLSAVRVQAMRADGTHVDLSTEYDGSAGFEKLMPGPYRIILDPDQAARLGMHLVDPLTVVVPPDGGVLPDVKGIVAFDRS